MKSPVATVLIIASWLVVSFAYPFGPGGQTEMCMLSADTGPCKAFIPRWFFNIKSGFCESFIYGGCLGNRNNFETPQECEEQCANLGPGLPVPEVFVQDTTNPKCQLPPVPGSCAAYIPRWFYDSYSGACYPFVYGGCEGNDNNFETREECERDCFPSQAKIAQDANVCSQPGGDPGPCYGYFLRYYYNREIGQCQQFIYGGCLGSKNNFESLMECEGTCRAMQLQV